MLVLHRSILLLNYIVFVYTIFISRKKYRIQYNINNSTNVINTVESLLMDTFKEIKYIKSLELRLFKIRVSYHNGPKTSLKIENKAILTTPHNSLKELPLIIEQFKSKCKSLNVPLDNISVIHFHLYFMPATLNFINSDKSHTLEAKL